jgi:hypothetical protein
MATTSTNQGFVYNHDVAGLHRRINRFIVEMAKSVSNSVSQFTDYDQARLLSYLGAVRAYVTWVVNQPLLDLPETSPREYVLDPNPVWDIVENEAVVDVLRMLELVRDEITNGQSARLSSSLVKFDVNRISAIVDKIEAFINDYVAVITPLDLPESSPMRAVATAGKTGV